MKAWVLEVNENPSLDIMIKRNMPDGSFQKTVGHADRFIKSQIIGSAIKLMKKKPNKRLEAESIGCYTRILPNEEIDQSYLVDIKAKRLFEVLLAGKKGALMTLSAFGKLSKCFK